MAELTAVETSSAVSNAIAAWVDAFKKLGTKVNDDKWAVFWVEETGVWIRPRDDADAAGSHWNALGVELNGRDRRKGIVQVNPPFSGSPPGTNQGLVATDEHGVIWILRRSRLAIAGRKLELDDYAVMADRQKITPVLVRYQDGSTMRCYPVAPIGEPAVTVASTRRFVDFCSLVRKSAFEGTDAADIEQKVLGFEEPSGTYTIPARDAADDILKAVGQLFVYEKLIGKRCRKVIILPAGTRDSNKDIVNSLDIEVVDYGWKPKISFQWPRDFFETDNRRPK